MSFLAKYPDISVHLEEHVSAAIAAHVADNERTTCTTGTPKTTLDNNLRFQQADAAALPKDMAHENPTAFVGWLRTAWHPYTSSVPLELRDAFLEDVGTHHAVSHAPDEQGRLHVDALRLQVRARKSSR
jgi:hypothetical protein